MRSKIPGFVLPGISLLLAAVTGAQWIGQPFRAVNMVTLIGMSMFAGVTLVQAVIHARIRSSPGVIAQLRTTDLPASIRFYTSLPGFSLAFQYQDFYAGIRVGMQVFHLKLADAKDPSIESVRRDGHFHLYFTTPDIRATASAVGRAGITLVQEVHDTAWGTREFAIEDNEGHTLYFAELAASAG
jgi:catechol 2,3-dioxygenase-like lactoylglutathione lyase family enzyme